MMTGFDQCLIDGKLDLCIKIGFPKNFGVFYNGNSFCLRDKEEFKKYISNLVVTNNLTKFTVLEKYKNSEIYKFMINFLLCKLHEENHTIISNGIIDEETYTICYIEFDIDFINFLYKYVK